MSQKFFHFFDSNEPDGKLHTCILLSIIFIVLAVIQIILRFIRADAHSLDHLVLAAVNTVIAAVMIIIAIHTSQKLKSNN